MSSRDKAAICGSIGLLLFGLYFIYSGFTLTIGTPRNMGPGFFPFVLGSLCSSLALADGLRGLRFSDAEPLEISWRALAAVILALLAFQLALGRLGLAPATFLLVALAAFGNPRAKWRETLLLALGAILLSWLIFVLALKLPIPLLKEIF